MTSEEVAGNSVYRAIVEAQGVRTEDTAITFSLPASPKDPNSENQKRKVNELPKATDPTLSTRVDKFLSQFPRIIGNRMSHSPPPPHQ